MTDRGRTAGVAGDSPFLPEALEANRDGRLTDAQRRSCLAQSRRVRWAGAGIGGLVIVLGLLFAVTRHAFAAAPQARYVRVFYLPRSRKAVNLERLPDPPAGEATIATMQESAKGTVSALGSRNTVKAAEAMAAQLAMQDRYQEQADKGPSAPPPDQLDPRPLAGAIVGSWASALLTVTFRADGTMTAAGPKDARATAGGRSGRTAAGRPTCSASRSPPAPGSRETS
jgi:hypothetical protein